MSPALLAFFIAAAGAVISLTVAVLLLARRSQPRVGESGIALMQQQLDALRQQTASALDANSRAVSQLAADLNRQLQENAGQVGERLDNAARVIRDVSAGLGELSRASQQIYEVGKDIASLQQILRAPKLRGVIGELFLGDLLHEIIPDSFELQHRFASGETVDAVVKLGGRLVPVDSKFPLENFQRLASATDDAERRKLRKQFAQDVRKHADAIAQKYILPDEGTFDFALMYIPAEGVYYETAVRAEPGEDSIAAHCISRRVIPVSPSTLYAHLQAVVLGLRGFRIEQRAAEIMAFLGRLQGDITRFRTEFDTVGTHLANARNRYEDATRQLDRLEERLDGEVRLPAPQPPPEQQLTP